MTSLVMIMKKDRKISKEIDGSMGGLTLTILIGTVVTLTTSLHYLVSMLDYAEEKEEE